MLEYLYVRLMERLMDEATRQDDVDDDDGDGDSDYFVMGPLY